MYPSGRSFVFLGVVTMFLMACGQEGAAPQADRPAAAASESETAAESAAPEGPALDERLAAADVKRGQTLFLQCRACHSLGEGEPHKVGPNLYGMFGQTAGQAPGFAYSEVMIESGVVWSPETLDAWLARPSEFMPGNRMVFVGIRKPLDRANLIAYLQQQTGPSSE